MKILKNEGKFEVLTQPKDIIHNIALAARTCYQSQNKSTPESDVKLVQSLLKRQHLAMYEFAHLNVRFSNVSRGFTHEMVRHRLASFAQESTRYVDESDLQVIVPPHKDHNKIVGIKPMESLTKMFHWAQISYQTLRSDGWKPEDARQILPIATQSQIIVGANIREWRHIFKMRCDYFAHWEIRTVMLQLLRWCQKNIPVVFDDYKFFKTDDGIEYARPIVQTHNIIKYIKDNGDVEKIIDGLPTGMQLKIYQQLQQKHWR